MLKSATGMTSTADVDGLRLYGESFEASTEIWRARGEIWSESKSTMFMLDYRAHLDTCPGRRVKAFADPVRDKL